jgi:hypothetical protein
VVVRDGGGGALGRVRAVSAVTVAAPGGAVPPEDPWWERAWDAVAGFFGRVWRAIFGD